MFKQHIILMVAIQGIYQKINLELDLFLAILIARVKYRLLSQNYSYANLELQRCKSQILINQFESDEKGGNGF